MRQTAIGVALVDAATGRFLQVNSKFCEILRMTEAQLLATTFMQITDPENLQANLEKLTTLMDGEIQSHSTEKSNIRNDGTIVWIRLTISAFSLPEKTVRHYLALAEDITRQKNEEDKFRQNEARLAEAQRIARIGSWEWYIETNDARWSDETFRIFGMERGNLDRHRESFLHFIVPDDRDRVDRALSDAIKFAREYDLDYRIELTDGTKKVIHAQAEVIRDTAGNPVLMRGTVQDITDREKAEYALRESEKKYRMLFETANDAIFIHNPSAAIIDVNKLACERYGFSREELLAMTIQNIDTADEAVHIADHIATIQQNGHASFETVHIAKDGRPIPTDVRSSAITWNNQPAIMSICRDITERKRLDEAIRKSRDELELRVMERTAELNESREQLRSLAAHLQSVREEERINIARDIHDELGQMLLGLKMNLSWLRDKYLDHKTIFEKVGSMLHILTVTIQSVRRICTELRPSLLDDMGLVAAMEWQANEFQKRTGIKCTVIEEPWDFELDKEKGIVFYRIFQEALTNVLKHARATEVTARLTLDNDNVTLEIIDNGKGITNKKLSKSQSFGLVGMRERAYPWGGSLEITGGKNKGTKIRVSMPLTKKRD